MWRTFTIEKQKFEIRTSVTSDALRVRVYQNNRQVSMEYSATIEVARDFKWQQGESLLEELMAIAEADVRRGNCSLSNHSVESE